jgi:hypothetical protein
MIPGIDVEIAQSERRAVISGPRLGKVELHLQDPEQLRKIVLKYSGQVEKAQPLGLPVYKSAARDFLAFVKKMAYHCFRESTTDNYDDLQDIFDLLYEAIARAVLRDVPLTVQITDDGGGYLPWEWLGSLYRASDYISEARTTLGFAGVVYRRLPYYEARRKGDREKSGGAATADVLDARQRLPVRFFRNPELDRTKVECRFLKFNDDVDFAGPLPEEAKDGQLALAEQLVDPAYPLAEFPDHQPDQVVHMACHHEVKGDQETASAYWLSTAESTLSFGKLDDPSREISITTLGNELATSPNRKAVTVDRPLIFLNACRGNFYPFTTESAVQVLLRNGNRGMISTAQRVPDDAAAELATFFYERLLDGDCSASQALLYAKWQLIGTRACPLGILYSYYGRPDLRVLPARHIPAQDPVIALWKGCKP